MSLALANYQWAEALILCLERLGCQHFFIAPGSRNAPLSMSCLRIARSSPHVNCHTHFDERSLGFAALGAAKASQQPTVVITSSGSAVANLLPAVVEAQQTQTPLVLLTADRPPELVGCGANQAIVQPGIFSHFASLTLNLPLPESGQTSARLDDMIQSLHQQLQTNPGPIHLNVPLREPLYSTETPLAPLPLPERPEIRVDMPEPDIQSIKAPILILAGQLTAHEAEAVLSLAEELHAPIFADIGSQLRQREHHLVIPFAHYLSQQPNPNLASVNTVLQFGGHLTSKPIMQWLEQFTGEYLLIDAHHAPLDPTRKAKQQTLPSHLWSSSFRSDAPSDTLQKGLAARQSTLRNVIETATTQQFSEFSCCALLSQLVSPEHSLFLGNSLTIRLFDQLAVTRHKPATVFTNRGASGIDGLIATSAGIGLASSKPATVVLGDLAALYDLNSLFWLGRSPVAITLVVLNNDGGQIFSMLPAAEQKDVFKDAFEQPHGLNFKAFAQGFGLQYSQAQSLQQLSDHYLQAQQGSVSHIIEIQLPKHAFKTHQQQIQRALKGSKHA